MSMRPWLMCIGLLAGLLCGVTSATGAQQANVIVFLADDMGFADVGVQGCKDIPTPNLDSIAHGGVRCTAGYVAAPVCSPSRAGLVTGMYQERFGHEFNPGAFKSWGMPQGQTTIAQRMKAAGYATAIVGKWHLGYGPGSRPTERGFDLHYGTPANTNSHFHPHLVDSRVNLDPTIVEADDFYDTDAYGREAVRFVHEHKAGPFFLYLAFNAVHTPSQAPQKYLDRFPTLDGTRRIYAGMLSALDDAVGGVLEELRASGLEGNTLVFFLSDNGAPGNNGGSNLPLHGNKSQTWDGGLHVPFFVQWKGRVPAGGVYERPVISLDILPTALAAAGVEARSEWGLDGVDLVPFLRGERTGDPHAGLYWRMGDQMAVRMGDWKLVRAMGIKGVSNALMTGAAEHLAEAHLFNLAKDGPETDNVAASEPEQAARLAAAWRQWNAGLTQPLWPPKQEAGEEGDGQPKKVKKKDKAAKKAAKA